MSDVDPFLEPPRGSQSQGGGVHGCLPLDPTFEADPIGRRLECLPQKRINIDFNFVFKGLYNGAQGALGVN